MIAARASSRCPRAMRVWTVLRIVVIFSRFSGESPEFSDLKGRGLSERGFCIISPTVGPVFATTVASSGGSSQMSSVSSMGSSLCISSVWLSHDFSAIIVSLGRASLRSHGSNDGSHIAEGVAEPTSRRSIGSSVGEVTSGSSRNGDTTSTASMCVSISFCT